MNLFTIGTNYYIGSMVPVVLRAGNNCESNIDDRYRFIFISKGVGMIETESGFSPFIAPTLCCINEKESIRIQSTQEYNLIELVYHPEFLNPFFDYKSMKTTPQAYIEDYPHEAAWLNAFSKRSSNYKGVININSGISLRIENLLIQIDNELTVQRDWYWPCRTRSLLLELLLVIDRIFVEPSANDSIILSDNYKIINDIIMYLLNHYHEKIQLTQLTEEFNINRTSLNEYFKKVTGHTVMSYLMNLRIHLAMAMLRDTALQVSEIMYRVGFINTSHFVRSFKKISGTSPLEYRKIHTWLYK
ncbi:MAG: AraC family transcriptional regulator [Herbinix sp.]|nr:AraC family transcriptional regulator [Herbinix sp.]